MNKKNNQMASPVLAPWMKWGAALLVVAILAGVVMFALYQKGTLAVVNGEKITIDDVKEQLGQYSLYDDTVEIDNVYYQDHIAPYVAYDRLLLQEAAKQGIAIEDSVIAEDAENTLKYLEVYFLYEAANAAEMEMDSAALFGTDEEKALEEKTRLETALGKTGAVMLDEKLTAAQLTRDYFTKVSASALTIEALKSKVKEGLVFTDEEIQAYYDENLEAKYIEKDTSHILVADEATANDVYAKLMAGADWVEMSDTYSTDEAAKASGGNIGYFPRTGGLVTEYITGAFALTENGQISQPVKTSFGYHIIRLEDTRTIELDAVKEQIKQDITTNKINAELVKVVEAAKISPEATKTTMISIAKGE